MVRTEEREEGIGRGGPPNKERRDGVGDGSLQSHSGANLHPKTAKNRRNVPKGGETDVALTTSRLATRPHRLPTIVGSIALILQ
jgi:hypothetical protein